MWDTSTEQPGDPSPKPGWYRNLIRLNTSLLEALVSCVSRGKGRSSTPLFWDMHPPTDKALPKLPNLGVEATPPRPPPPLIERRPLVETRGGPMRRTKRISWTEQEINKLQIDNKELRQKILDQKRIDMEKDRTIAHLKGENSRYIREIDRQSEATQLANSIIVAVQDYQRSKSPSGSSGDINTDDSRDEETLGDAVDDAISGIIQIYNEL